jgi:hypothetical protein
MAPSPQQRMERLELARFFALSSPNWLWIPVPTATEMLSGLSAMRHLTHLRLSHIFGVDALLACLHAAPALRVLELDLAPDPANSQLRPINPSAATVRSLLNRVPQLEVRLLLAASVGEWLTGYGGSSPKAELTAQWKQLRRDFSNISRVSIVAPHGATQSD